MARRPKRVTKIYGRGSLLGFLSPLLAWAMASRGIDGWEQQAAGEMQDDAVEMQRLGYRVISADEYTFPILGIAWFKVTYELGASDQPTP